ncbi:MAG: AAA family ATPase [Gammaproteobacteria bacterium]|nr:AAA family ATPase [Gammaproteobacteria bacterium]
MSQEIPNWCIYRGSGKRNTDNTLSPHLAALKEPPPWRRFDRQAKQERGATFEPEPEEILRVNAALLLRRPLLITGKPGTGKTSLTYAVAHELGLEPVLRWSITSRAVLQDGLYRYDAIGRLQDTPRAGAHEGEQPDISKYLTLGPLGTALFARTHQTGDEKTVYYPRVLLIDEIDKSDIDLPNDLLHLFEEGEFEIPELARLEHFYPGSHDDDDSMSSQHDRQELQKAEFYLKPHDYDDPVSFQYRRKVPVPADGRIHCHAFPLVIMTSNGEREFPPAFLRRCLQLEIQLPDAKKMARIVSRHFAAHPRFQAREETVMKQINGLIHQFLDRRDGKNGGQKQDLSTDQLLNAIYLVLENIDPAHKLDKQALVDTLWRPLSGMEGF